MMRFKPFIHTCLSQVQSLTDLDMQAIKDNQAKKLSGVPKKTILRIAVLGNPKVSR